MVRKFTGILISLLLCSVAILAQADTIGAPLGEGATYVPLEGVPIDYKQEASWGLICKTNVVMDDNKTILVCREKEVVAATPGDCKCTIPHSSATAPGKIVPQPTTQLVQVVLSQIKDCSQDESLEGSPYNFNCIRRQGAVARDLIQKAYGEKAAAATGSLDLMLGGLDITATDHGKKTDPLDCISGWYPALDSLAFDSDCIKRELIRVQRQLPAK